MRRLLLALTGVLLAAVVAFLLALRSEPFVLGAMQWAVRTFSNLRLELVNPEVDLYAGKLSADEIHLIPETGDEPALLSVLDFATQRGFVAASGAPQSGSSVRASSVLIYVSDSDSSADPQPMQWLGYLDWLPAQLRIEQVHLVTASANTWIFPLKGLHGDRLENSNYRLSANADYGGEPLEVTLDLLAVDKGSGVTAAQTRIKLVAPLSGSEFNLAGTFEGNRQYFQYKLELNAFYRDIREFFKGFEGGADLAGQLRMQGTMVGDTSGFVLSDTTFLLNNLPDYAFQAGGWLDYRLSGDTNMELVANGEMASVSYLVDWIDLDLGELGAAQSNIRLTGSLDQPVIESFSLTTTSAEGLTVNINGRLNLYEARQDSESGENTLLVEMQGPSLSVLKRWLGDLTFDLGAWHATGRLTGYRDKLILQDVQVETGTPETVELRATGAVGSIHRIPGNDENYVLEDIQLRIDAHALDSAALIALLQLDVIPPYHEVTASIDISGTGKELKLNDGELLVSARDLEGKIGPLSAVYRPGAPKPLADLVAPVLVELSDVAALSQYTSQPMPVLGPLRLTGVLAQKGEVFQLRDMHGVITEGDMKIDTRGGIGNLATLSDVSLDGKLEGVDTRTLITTLLPDFNYAEPLGKLEGAFKLLDKKGAWALSDLSLHSGTNKTPLEFSVAGTVSDLTGKISADLNAQLRVDDSVLIKALSGVAMNPVSASLVMTTSPGQIESTLRGRAGDTQLNGHALVALTEKGIEGVKVTLDTPHLHLQDLGLSQAQDDTNEDPTGSPGQSATALEKLRRQAPAFPVDIALTVGEISGQYSSIDSLQVRVTGQDNRYTLAQFSAQYNQALAEIRGIIDLNPDPPALSLAGQASALPLGALLKDVGIDINVSGALTVLGGFTLMGDSSETLIKNLNGSVAFALENAVIEGAAYDLLATDLLAWIYSGALTEKSTYLDCTMAKFQLRQGVASSDSLYIESAKMLATGSAEFDLVQGRMDLRITPMSKSRLLQVPSEVRLKGKMSDPKADISPVSAVADATSAALMLIPSLTLKLFGVDTSSNKNHRPCQADLGN